MYVLAKNQSLVALDATTGKELWIHAGLRGIARRGINYWESPDGRERRLIFQINNNLQAIDARDRQVDPDASATNGLVDLREGLGRDPAMVGRVAVGHAGQDLREPDPARLGARRRLPVGARARCAPTTSSPASWCGRSTRCRIPASTATRRGRRTPGSTSAAPTPGARSRSTRGAASPTSRPARRPTTTTAPIASAATSTRTRLIALDARTGKRLWHFQVVHHDLWDYDLTAAPQLITVQHERQDDRRRGAGRQARLPVRVRSRDRRAAVADRGAADRRRATVPGEQTWPTQPFPDEAGAVRPSADDRRRSDAAVPHRRRAGVLDRAAEEGEKRPVRAALDRARDDRRARRGRRRQLGQHRGVSGEGPGLRHQPGLPVVLQALGDAAQPWSAGGGPRRRAGTARRAALYAQTVPGVPRSRPCRHRRRRRRCSASARGRSTTTSARSCCVGRGHMPAFPSTDDEAMRAMWDFITDAAAAPGASPNAAPAAGALPGAAGPGATAPAARRPMAPSSRRAVRRAVSTSGPGPASVRVARRTRRASTRRSRATTPATVSASRTS